MIQDFTFQRISSSSMQINELKSKFIIQKNIGYGDYGTVYQGVNMHTRETVAIKELSHCINDEGINAQALREIEILRSLHCDQIVLFKELAYQKRKTYIIMEYMEEDLLTAMRRDIFTEVQAKQIMFQVLKGLAYLHDLGIIHRDLKPNNILHKNLTIKICDLGMAQNLKKFKPQTTRIQNHSYRAPEVFLGQKYCSKVDLWSAGVLFIELLFRGNPFKGQSEANSFQQILKLCGTPTEETWQGVTTLKNYSKLINNENFPKILHTMLERKMSPLLVNLIDQMLTLDPTKRISAHAALQHLYFQGMNIERQLSLTQEDEQKELKLKAKLIPKCIIILMEKEQLLFRKYIEKTIFYAFEEDCQTLGQQIKLFDIIQSNQFSFNNQIEQIQLIIKQSALLEMVECFHNQIDVLLSLQMHFLQNQYENNLQYILTTTIFFQFWNQSQLSKNTNLFNQKQLEKTQIILQQMGCTSAKLKSKKDLCFLNVPLQAGRKMSKEEGIITREYKINSTRMNQVKKQIVSEVSSLTEGRIISNN